MFNRRSEAEISLTSALPAPRRIAWWIWTGLGVIGLFGLLAWAGEEHRAWADGEWDNWMWGWAQNFTGWVAQVCGGLGRVFGAEAGLSFGQRLTFFLVVLAVIYLYWRATRALLAYTPGPVDVQELVDATPPGTLNPSTTDLTAELRRQLSDIKMYAPTTLPAEAPPMSFLELVGDVELDPKKLGSALPRLLSRLRPKLAYRVGGVLRIREFEPDKLGVTVTVTAYVFGGACSTTLWANDWGEVIRKAGCWVISSLLPITRAGRQPPWRKWWGRELNPELYEAYQNANELRRAGHYHEALPLYYKAISLDPANPYLRGELAEIQEKMGLHIDALDTCQRALTLDGQTVGQYNKRLWQRPWNLHWRRLRYLRHPRSHRDSLGLRYRNVIAMGTSENIAEQWYERSGTSSKGTQDRLIPLLVERYWPAVEGLAPPGRERDWLTNALKRSANEGNTETAAASTSLVRLVFQRAAMQEMKRLAADDWWARLAGIYWPARLRSLMRLVWPFSYTQNVIGSPQPVTRGAFRVNREVWAPLRLAWAEQVWTKTQGPVRNPHVHYAWRTGPSVALPIEPEELEKRMSRAQSRVTLLRYICPLWRCRDWLTHYNSACVYAMAMKATSGNGGCDEQHVKHAVEELEMAVLVPRGDFATVERTWMAYEDPDLELLRHQSSFVSFVSTAYPGPDDVSHMPKSDNWLEEQLREYDYRLLEASAKVMQKVWNLRAEESTVDIRVATEWLRTESEIWKYVHEVADFERLGRWIDRVELIRSVQVNGHAVLSSTPEFPPRLPPDGATPDDCEPINEVLKQLEKDLEREMEWDDAPYLGQDVLREATANGISLLKRRTVRKLCSGYSAAWQTLGEWLAQDRDEKPFLEALEKVPQPTRRRRLAISDPRRVLI